MPWLYQPRESKWVLIGQDTDGLQNVDCALTRATRTWHTFPTEPRAASQLDYSEVAWCHDDRRVAMFGGVLETCSHADRRESMPPHNPNS